MQQTVRLRKCEPRDTLPTFLARELEVHHVELELQNEELQRSRVELETARTRYIELFEHAPVPYVTLDQGGRILEANAAAAALFGVERASLLRKPISSFMRSPDADTFYLFRHEVLRMARKGTCEIALRCAGSTMRSVRVVATAPPGLTGECRCALLDLSTLSHARDREDLLARLRETETRFDLIAEHVDDAFYIAASDGSFSYVSPAAERIWGCSTKDVLGDPDVRLDGILPDDRPALERALDGLRRGAPLDVEYRVIDPKGAIRWIHDRASPIEDETGNITRIVGVARDRTKERELELRQGHATDGNGLPAELVHDLSNALQAILNCTVLAADDKASPDQVQKYMRHAKEAAIRAADLMRRSPSSPPAALPSPSREPVEPTARRSTVLLVEDEDASRRALHKLLAGSGLSVHAVGSVAEARSIIANETIDVLLTDMRLPDGTGDGLAAELVQQQPSVSIVYMSGVPASVTRVAGTYLEKPIDVDQLLALVERKARPESEPILEVSSGRNGKTLAELLSRRPLQLVVRRRQGNGAVSDFAVRARTPRTLRRDLRALLELANAERGEGVWSDRDPELWLDGHLLGRLGPETDTARFIDGVLEHFA